MGVAKNCPIGYTATRKPSIRKPLFKDVPTGSIKNSDNGFANSCGITGIRIPIPSKSIKTVQKIITIILFLNIIAPLAYDYVGEGLGGEGLNNVEHKTHSHQ